MASLFESLARIETIVGSRPGTWSDRRFVTWLAHEGAIDDGLAIELAIRLEQAAFAPSASVDDDAPLLDRLERCLADLEAQPTLIDRLRSDLGLIGRPAPSPPPIEVKDPEPIEEPEEFETETEIPIPPRFVLTRWERFLAVIAVALLLVVGHFGLGWLRWARDEAAAVIEGNAGPTRNARRQAELRRRIMSAPNDPTPLIGYANQLALLGEEPEHIVFLERFIRQMPNDARALNELAWLYCTADELHLRDPSRALYLAERAYAIDRSAPITDTLAEAAFLTGDIERAVVLERQAIVSVVGDRSFYEGQLERFERALANQLD